MKSDIKIKSLNKEYIVQFNNLPWTLNSTNQFYVVDDYFAHQVDEIQSPKFLLESLESNKSLNTCSQILEFLSQNGCNKDGTLIAVGGGIIQDLSTLAASIFMRGISWIYYPTTLAAMLDSCVGGKSSINLDSKKNILGNFYPPSSIIINLEFLNTLTPIDMASGILEGVKICFAKGPDQFKGFSESFELKNFDDLIYRSLECKKWFIEIDEHDKAERRLLNFGHTFGHAIESATDFTVPHGVAIGIGMVAAISHPLAVNTGQIPLLQDFILRILEPLKENFRSSLESLDEGKFLTAFRSDKKHSQNKFNLILPGLNGLDVFGIAKSPINEVETFKSVLRAIELLYAR